MELPSRYFATPAVNMVNAYLAAMKLVFAEGLDERYLRHDQFGKGVRKALAEFGMHAIAAEEVAAPTLSCILYPDGVDDVAFRKALADKGLVIAGALAALAGKAFRIGHMGNTNKEMLQQAITLIGETLIELGYNVDIDAALAHLSR